MSLNSDIKYEADYSLKHLFGLDHHTVVVTGAAGQLGGEFVTMLLGQNAKVIAVDLDKKALDKRLGEHKHLLKIVCDTPKENQVKKVFQEAIGKDFFPTALINNAGLSVFENFSERDEDNFDIVMDVNLKGCFWFIKHFIANARTKTDNKEYNIVNIASHYGIISPDFRIYEEGDRKNSEIYGATKAGLIQMTKYFAANLAKENIRVNAIAPGGIRNPWTPQSKKFIEKYSYRCPMGRMAELHEIVGGVCYLLSKSSSYVNGHTLVIDGGMTSW